MEVGMAFWYDEYACVGGNFVWFVGMMSRIVLLVIVIGLLV